jgi:hypothetical protein
MILPYNANPTPDGIFGKDTGKRSAIRFQRSERTPGAKARPLDGDSQCRAKNDAVAPFA